MQKVVGSSPIIRSQESPVNAGLSSSQFRDSVAGPWRQVLDYFDAFTVGLTATPNKQAFGFFNQNLVMEYGHEQAADGVNVDFDVYRIRTEISERGGAIEAGIVTQFRDRQTRRTRWEALDDELTYEAKELDRAVVTRDQIRPVLETFRDRLPTENLPGAERSAEDA